MKKILVIEDDKVVRSNITSLLSEEGYIVFAAAEGKEGIKIAKQEIPDLIICDIMMQGLDGYEVLQELSKHRATKSVPFIFLTAKVEKEDIRRGMNLGADDYLFKPFDADDLLKSISSRLKRIDMLKEDNGSEQEEDEPGKYSLDDKFFVQVNSKTYLVSISDIISVTAEKQYTTVKTCDNKSYLIRKPITKWETMLPEKKFLRIHRSTIINIDYLVKMEAWFNSGYLVYLKGIDKPYIISRRYSSKLRGKLFK